MSRGATTASGWPATSNGTASSIAVDSEGAGVSPDTGVDRLRAFHRGLKEKRRGNPIGAWAGWHVRWMSNVHAKFGGHQAEALVCNRHCHKRHRERLRPLRADRQRRGCEFALCACAVAWPLILIAVTALHQFLATFPISATRRGSPCEAIDDG